MGCKLISRYYLEDYLSFKKVDLEFKKGLVVFTGPSGAGKSVLMGSILGLFGFSDSKAVLSEVLLEDLNLELESYGVQKDDDIVLKQTTATKTRYFLNNQTISKKSLKEFSLTFASFLHLKDTSDFDSSKIVSFLDNLISKTNSEYIEILKNFSSKFEEFKSIEKKLKKIQKDESELEDLKEFAKFEIEKISKIDPKVDEYDELKSIKDSLSKKDKLQDILDGAAPFLSNSHKISQALTLLDEDSGFFDDAVNEVNSIFEKFYDKLSTMDDMDIEAVLDRIEQLSSLIKRFGDIESALEYKKEKQIELDGYENISFEKAILEKNYKKLSKEIDDQAKVLSNYRKENLKIFENKINEYLKFLYLENLSIEISKKDLDKSGIDSICFKLNNIELEKVSSGEFNRLRLALLTARSFYEKESSGLLFLDEIDANLSGKESQSIAKVLKELSKNYQIFAISHQPQLSAVADQHFMVLKQNNVSNVIDLDKQQKIQEIARMISGEQITQEATVFATKLVEENV